MCHGHPRDHLCSHSSIIWYYCPSAEIDMVTGTQSPCSCVHLTPAQLTTSGCPLQSCFYKEKLGVWYCCQCKQGPNTKGWCTMDLPTYQDEGDLARISCDHGCCENCIEAARSEVSDLAICYKDLDLLSDESKTTDSSSSSSSGIWTPYANSYSTDASSPEMDELVDVGLDSGKDKRRR